MNTRIAVIAGLLLGVLCILAFCTPVIASMSSEREEKQDAFGMGTRTDLPVQNSPVADPVITPVVTDEAAVQPEPKGETPQQARSSEQPKQARQVGKTSARREEARPVVTIREITPAKETQPVVQAAPEPDAAAQIVAEASVRPDKIAMLDQGSKHGSRKAEQGGISAGSIFSTVLKLGIVLALAYVTILVLKWMSNKKPVVSHSTSRDLKVVDTIRLSPNNTVHIINAKGKTLLIGCSSGQVNVLDEFEADSVEEEAAVPSSGRFSEYLSKYSESSGYTTPASRVAGVLRDCTEYLKNRNAGISGGRRGGSDEA